ncbi:MAG TPA: aldo/keto reductase [Xanthobacteraceae bacterium]|jgi:pyridoxine 4-dehydrogenase|nr:aldo/keto reductase [Xanthobacteraceae bacterium]
MTELNAALAGEFTIGSDITINRLGFGAMRLTGPGIWGKPEDPEECLRVLRRLPELGLNFIDTADAYGPHVSEMLIREALHPYDGLVIATKGGLVRTGPEQWIPLGRPEYLRQSVLMSIRRLGVDRIDLWQLHRIDPKVPRDEQFDAIRGFIKEGLIRYAGLSQVGIPDIEAAQLFFEVVSVQNLYNLVDRSSEEVLDHCEAEAIGFIPWYPLASGNLARPGSILEDMASKYRATRSQIALAWLLKRSPNIIPIPGTAKVAHLEENVAACAIHLSDQDFDLLDREGWQVWRKAA